jgi:exosortase/archaeosortase family protein
MWVTRVMLLAAAVPIAIIANGARVAAAGWLPPLEAGTPHLIAGWFIFVMCLASLMLVRLIFNKVYVPCRS